jgi:hypothetical protein
MSKCPHCGAELDGLLAHATHPCFGNTVEYKVPTNNEMRISLMEMGAPNLLFETFGLAVPTEMEREIYYKPQPEPEPEEQEVDEVIEFLGSKWTEEEMYEYLCFTAFPMRGFQLHLKEHKFRLRMLEKYAPGSEMHLSQITFVKAMEDWRSLGPANDTAEQNEKVN